MAFANDLQKISFNKKQILMCTMYFLIQNVMILITVKLITIKHMLKYNKTQSFFIILTIVKYILKFEYIAQSLYRT